MAKTRTPTEPSVNDSNATLLPELPQSRVAEGAMIASMILDPKAIPGILRIVPKAEMVYDEDLREIWLSVTRLYHDPEQTVDGVTVLAELEQRRVLDQIGGRDFVQRVLDTVPGGSSGEHYARIVADRAVRRSLLQAAAEITKAAQTADNAQEAVDQAGEALSATLSLTGTTDRVVTVMEAMQEAYRQIEQHTEPSVLMTWPDLHDAIVGAYPGEMMVIAGRPGHGKTAFALSLILRNYLLGKARRCLYVSLEMPVADLMKRCLCMLTKIPFGALRDGQHLSPQEWQGLNAAMSDVQDWDVLLSANVQATPSAIRNLARMLHDRKPLDAVIVDYIQRLHLPDKRATRDWEMTVISNALKNLALELNCPVIILSQLNRACDSREDHRPRQSDLRDSGSIEQDADSILTVYRPDCYEPDADKHTNVAEIGIVKNRHGPLQTVQLTWIPTGMTFETIAQESELWTEPTTE